MGKGDKKTRRGKNGTNDKRRDANQKLLRSEVSYTGFGSSWA